MIFLLKNMSTICPQKVLLISTKIIKKNIILYIIITGIILCFNKLLNRYPTYLYYVQPNLLVPYYTRKLNYGNQTKFEKNYLHDLRIEKETSILFQSYFSVLAKAFNKVSFFLTLLRYTFLHLKDQVTVNLNA